MLVRGQTTEQRIAEIAGDFQKGLQGYQAGQQRFNEAQTAENKYQDALTLQKNELEAKKAERTRAMNAEALANERNAKADKRAEETHLATMSELLAPAGSGKKFQEAKMLAEVIARAKAGAKGGGISLTKGEEKVDTDYAKDINEWTSSGKSNLAKNLQSLKEARDALDSDNSLSGGLTGILPDRLTANRVLAQRQRVGSAVQGSLKAALGTSFTEGEGNRALANSYNEAADAKTNKASLDKLITELETKAVVNDQRADFFQRNGTLKGFKGASDSVNTKRAAPLRVNPQQAQQIKSMSDADLIKFLQDG